MRGLNVMWIVWVAVGCTGLAAAETSVGWRGNGTGVYPDANPPVKWSATENVLWKTPLPGKSNASPILVGDRIFICSEPSTLLCVSAKDGAILWSSSTTYADEDDETTYAAYTYLGAGTIVRIAHPAVQGGLVLNYDPNDNQTYTGWDRFGRVVDQTWKVGSTTVDSYGYAYDRNSNRLYRENLLQASLSELYHANNPTPGTEYDGLDRLKEWYRGTLDAEKDGISGSPSYHQLFTLDTLGNWGEDKIDANGDGDYTDQGDLDQDRTHDAANQINDIDGGSWIDPVYDTAGNMTSGPAPDAETTTELNFVYDAWNRLVKVTDGDENTIAEYRYDGLGRRIAKIVPNGDDWDRTDYHYDEAWQCLEQRYGQGQPKETVPDTPNVQYLWDIRYIDAPVLRWRSVSGPLDEVLYVCDDANMNATALVSTSGTVVERYVYDAYGKATVYDDEWSTAVAWDDSVKNEVRYCGYRWDFETGLYQVRCRYYHPSLGRFMQRDPGQYSDSPNLYEYAQGRPSNCTDPQGRVVVVITGFGVQPTDPDAINLGTDIALEVADRVRPFDASRDIEVKILQGGGGAGIGESHLRQEYQKFVKRKEQNQCSLEQFVAVAHSDGATAIYHLLREGAFNGQYTPAYLGLLDLVRTEYGLFGLDVFTINYDVTGYVTISKPKDTVVQNFRQTRGVWKGRYVRGADLNVNVNTFFGSSLTHMGVFRDSAVRDLVSHKAGLFYGYRVANENREKPWSRRPGEYW